MVLSSENSDGNVSEFIANTDIPRLKAVLFAEFDTQIGQVPSYQVPSQVVERHNFQKFAKAIIPKPELLNRMLKITFADFKLMGFPIGLEHDRYPRGQYIFNLCFILPCSSSVDCIFEPIVQKCAEYLVDLEIECAFLSDGQKRILPLLEAIFEGLNTRGEVRYRVTPETTVYLRICPLFRGVEPPMPSSYSVPLFTRAVDPENMSFFEELDVLAKLVCPKIDGVNCVRDIASLVNMDIQLVRRCIRGLIFYGCVTLLPFFLYSNTYVATEKIHDCLYKNEERQRECLEFVKLRPEGPTPVFSDVFRLYMSLTCGQTLMEWMKKMNPRELHVDERRFVQFGRFCGFVRQLSTYPIVREMEAREESTMSQIMKYADGSHALEDLAINYSIHPTKLYELLKTSENFEFISK